MPTTIQDTVPNRLVVRASAETFPALGLDHGIPIQVVLENTDPPVTLVALGSGVRKKLMFRVYEAVAYVDEGVELGSEPYRAFMEGEFTRRLELHFDRDVDAGKIQEAFQEGFQRVFGESGVPRELASDVDQLVGYFSEADVHDGDMIALTWVPGRGLYTDVAGEPFPVIGNKGLAPSLFAIWFGPNPVSEELKRDLLRLHLEEP
jgi:hypothetical protein